MAPKTVLIDSNRAVDFIDVAFQLHRDDPHWIPPLQMQQLEELAGGSAFFRHGAIRMWLCEDRGSPRGRIATLTNERLPGVGQVGYFECSDDDRVAAQLFDAAFRALRQDGVQQVMGPMNGGLHRTHGLLTSGFLTEPFLFEPRNPDYYSRLFAANGFVPLHHYRSYELDRSALEALADRLHRLVDRSGHDVAEYHVEPIDTARGVSPRMRELFDAAWHQRIGYSSPTVDELQEVFGPLFELQLERCAEVLVDAHEAPLAFVFMYPDFGREVHGLAGDDSAWGRWNRFPQSRRMVLDTAATLTGPADSDAVHLILEHAARVALESGFERMVVGPTDEEPRFFRGIAEPSRDYVLYGRPL